MALGIGYGLPFVAQHGTNPYKTQWAAAREGAKGAGATVEDENAGTGSCLVARGQDVYTDGLPFTPSMLIVPQFYKEGNLYQDVPPFVAEDSTMRFTVSRNTEARRVNSSGLIESVASGVPRIDWLGQSCPALLVEPAAANLALHSRDLTNAVWSGTNITTAKNAVGADGVASGATTLTATAANGTILQSTSHNQFLRVFSAYVRRVTGTGTIQMTVNGGTNWDTVTISSTYTQVASAIRSIASGTVGFRMAASGDVIEVDFTQYEATTVTSPIPTTTTALVSRAADVISASGALVSGLIGQTEGTIYAEVDLRNWIASGRILTCSNGTSNERIMIQVGANRTLQAIVTTASADVANISTASGQVNGVYKCALTYASGDFAFYVNGTQIGTDSSGGVPACTSVFLGKIETSASTNFINDRIRAAALYTTRLSNDQLAELTRL